MAAKTNGSLNSEDLTEDLYITPLAREKVKDITEARIPLTVRNLFIIGIALFGSGAAATAAWLDIRTETKANREEIKVMQCDIRELKNFMLYGEKPGSKSECK